MDIEGGATKDGPDALLVAGSHELWGRDVEEAINRLGEQDLSYLVLQLEGEDGDDLLAGTSPDSWSGGGGGGAWLGLGQRDL